jgi:negative regulator of sigma E activity
MMGMNRLRELLEAYGADPGRWPADERPAAIALLRDDPEAQRLQRRAAAIDSLLDRATPIAPPIIDAEKLVAAITAEPQKTAEIVTLRPARRPSPGTFWLKVASLAAAAAIGFLVSATQFTSFGDSSSSPTSGLELADVSPW